MTDANKHSPIEDAQGLIIGSSMMSFSVLILTHLGLITGQTAGLAILISYITGYPFGAVFFVINLPFYWLGYKGIGLHFVIKTFIAVGLLSVISSAMPNYISFDMLDPLAGALLFGLIAGAGLIILIRHGASLGGIGILAIYLQDKTGFRAGWTQLIFDGLLFLVAFFTLDTAIVVYSFLGAAIVNVVIGINHRRDRYIAK
jgi:uncharacterized membrane-anchored protein YitT (DUF2179 family)